MTTARIDRTFDIDIATMWSLWTDPSHLARWFRPSVDDFGPSLASMDLRPGGAYRIEMVRRDGQVHAVAGTVIEIDEPTKLALTWRWDGADNESLVDITLTEYNGKTSVVIDHTRLVDVDDAELHAQGWTGCLDSLAASL